MVIFKLTTMFYYS